MKKPKTIKEMLAFITELRKKSEADLKRQKIELKQYDKLLKKEEAIVAEIEAKYKIKSRDRHGKKL